MIQLFRTFTTAMTNNDDDALKMAPVFRNPGWSEQDVLECYKLFFEKALALPDIHNFKVFNSISSPLVQDLSEVLGRSVDNRAVREQVQRLRNHYNLFTKFLQRMHSKVDSKTGEVRVNKFYRFYAWPEKNTIEQFLRTTGFKWHSGCMLVFEMREAAKICFNDALQSTFDVPSDSESSSAV
ncbi:DNA polymerase IV [Striga asiatica]|uniref:DNA polymerase IV n=1 Tax=Striga asiatica TaxID=4170 RepID=A0A5A7QHY6_STRAF|nr:DNA polymerase IV [Striga asiatica]